MYDLVVSNIHGSMTIFTRNELRVCIRVKLSQDYITRLKTLENLKYLLAGNLELSWIIDNEQRPLEDFYVSKPSQEFCLECVEPLPHAHYLLKIVLFQGASLTSS